MPGINSCRKFRRTMLGGSLRSKFLFALVLISALLTFSTLLLVRHRVEIRVREKIVEGLTNSVSTFRTMQQQREGMLERSAALLASLPPLKAVMTSQDMATIQDGSTTFWDLSGSQVLVLADRAGNLMAVHAAAPGFTRTEARESMARSLANHQTRDWWFGNRHLFQMFFQPIYFGPTGNDVEIGVLGVGYEIGSREAADVGRVASSQVAFLYGNQAVASTLSTVQAQELARQVEGAERFEGKAAEMDLGRERFLATAVNLPPGSSGSVTLTVLKSYDEAMAFLKSLDRWIVAVGIVGVLAGSVLVFFVSTTFTRPLAELAAGVQALEEGNFSHPLEARGNDEVSALTAAFLRMRQRLQESQRELLDAERLATIGRMATTISHDLRHPLTAIMAYAEFLSEGGLEESRRKDCFQEIRIAVNRMTDEIVERAVATVKVLPEFQSVEISYQRSGELEAWFDPGKVERVVLNLLFNACEAVDSKSGRIAILSSTTGSGMEIRVADNGPGIPEDIRQYLF